MAVHAVVRLALGIHHGEVRIGKVDVGRTHLHAHVRTRVGGIREHRATAFVQVDGPVLHLLRLALEGEHRRHEVVGEPGLQVRGLVGHDGVAGGVALVEAVARELHDQVEELARAPRIHAARSGARHELLARGVDELLVLLADGLDDRVRLAERDAAEEVQDLHDLLLIDHDSVGLGQERIHRLVHRGHRLLAVLARVVVRDQAHRARTEERVGRDQVLQAVRLHVREQATHAARFELEHAARVRAPEGAQDALVFQRNAVEVERMRAAVARLAADAAVDGLLGHGLAHQFLGELDGGERAQAQEVHLQEAGLLAERAFPLRHHFVAAAGGTAERDDVVEGLRGDHHAGGVDALRARVVLEFLGAVHHAPHGLVGVVGGLEIRALRERLLEGHVRRFRHQVRDALPFRGRQAHDARHVLDGVLRLQAPEGGDLRHVAVLLAHVLDDRAAAVLAEVDVDVGVFAAVRVGEALEEQAVAHRARVGEAEHVAHHGADARATRGGGDAVLARPVDEVPHDEEVGADGLVGKHLQLALGARAHGGRDAVDAVAPDEAGFGKIAQRTVAVGAQLGLGDVGVLGGIEGQQLDGAAVALEPLGEVAVLLGVVLRLAAAVADPHHRRVLHVLRERDVAAVGDAQRVGERLALGVVLAEERVHLLGALDVEALRIADAVRDVLRLSHRDAAERVVGIVVLLAEEVRVVVADQRQAELLGDLLEERVDALLVVHVALELDVEARLAGSVRAERLGMPLRFLDRGLPVLLLVGADELLQVERDARTEVAVDGDQPAVELRERGLVHARLVVEAVDEGIARELEEVAPAVEVLRQEHQVEAAIGHAGVGAVAAVARGHVGLDAEDRLDAHLLGRHVELERAEEVAVVGDGHRVHAELLDAVDQLLQPVAAVEERVLAVKVQVDETRTGSLRAGRGGRGIRAGFRTACCHGLPVEGRIVGGRAIRSMAGMETRTIVVKNIEIGGGPPDGGAGGPAGGGTGGPGGNPLAWLLRLAFRVVLVVLALAIAIPVIVLGAGCLVVAVVIGLLLWGIRRIFGVRVGPQVSVSAMRAGFPAGFQTGVPATEDPPVQDGRDDGRENVRVRK